MTGCEKIILSLILLKGSQKSVNGHSSGLHLAQPYRNWHKPSGVPNLDPDPDLTHAAVSTPDADSVAAVPGAAASSGAMRRSARMEPVINVTRKNVVHLVLESTWHLQLRDCEHLDAIRRGCCQLNQGDDLAPGDDSSACHLLPTTMSCRDPNHPADCCPLGILTSSLRGSVSVESPPSGLSWPRPREVIFFVLVKIHNWNPKPPS